MSPRYPIPGGNHRVEEEIKRSRFITTVAYTPTVEAAKAFIAEIKAEFGDATHNCWAYLVGPPGGTAQIGYSDDGEPHGTAGRPMFTVLQHSGLGDIAAVVTRYYGGTNLGKGGLVRAYSSGPQYALEDLPVAEHVPKVELEVVIDYTTVSPVQRMLSEFEAVIVDETYAADVSYRIKLPEDLADVFERALVGLTKGTVLVDRVGSSGPYADMI